MCSAEKLKNLNQGNTAGKNEMIAAFDFDGTCIRGNSPVLLVRQLVARHMLPPSVVARIGAWGAAYKFRLPQNEAWVRGLVFRAFAGMPVGEVDAFLQDFYFQHVDKLFRPRALEEMEQLHKQGVKIVAVTATFEPIITACMQVRPIDFQIATKMRKASDGTYMCEVDGKPVEGEEKIVQLKQFANEKWGSSNWQLEYAYGDHHSDRSMLACAKHAFAVNPDKPLLRTAHKSGYSVLKW